VERRRKSASAPAQAGVAQALEPREAIDPVCGMMVSIAGAHHVAEVGDRKFYFFCGGCRSKFLADPARYPPPREKAHT